MERLIVRGRKKLSGEIRISGAKNAALPILTAALLSEEPCTICNIPHLNDTTTVLELFACMGVRHTLNDDLDVEVDARNISSFEAPQELVRTMRASILVLGPLVARFGEAKVFFPGGCAIGARPIDMHLDGIRALGADVQIRDGCIYARSRRLKGAHIVFDKITVGGTENVLQAATLAKGQTIIENAAVEPEIGDLIACLNSMGADIQGAGTQRLVINGVSRLHATKYRIMPDRIEAGTYLTTVATTGGSIMLKNVAPNLLNAVLEKLQEAGADIHLGADHIELKMERERPRAVNVETAPFPGFPTDMQAQLTALNTVAVGESRVTENIFENRLIQTHEMRRMGADIKITGNTATVRGLESLTGANVRATDLRASASLLIAALVAKGETVIHGIHHIDRGYERIEEKLQKLGADVRRVLDNVSD